MAESISLYEQVQQATDYIFSRSDLRPQTAIVLGTGLGALKDQVNAEVIISFEDIPFFPTPTAPSHIGKLYIGKYGGQTVALLAGRFHYYEGYSSKEVTFPIRVMKGIGVQTILFSNVAGGTNPNLLAGDLVFIKDHIYLQPENPLRGPNDARLGPRFPDMLGAYDQEIRERALEIGKELGLRVHEGVYVCLQGPNLETPAEYNFIHIIGGDVVGMSTIPEVIVARHMGIRVMVISIVSNVCYPLERIQPTTVDSVIKIAEEVSPKLQVLVERLLTAIKK